MAYQLGASPQPELAVDVHAVGLDRAPRQMQLGRDLGARVAQREQPQDLGLARAQPPRTSRAIRITVRAPSRPSTLIVIGASMVALSVANFWGRSTK